MAEDSKELRRLLMALVDAREKLEPYSISNVAHYAEHLFAKATGGKRAKGPTPAYDVVASLGKIQVKARQLPKDGRKEERLHCENATCDGCDWLGAVIFEPDFRVRKALMVPMRDAMTVIRESHDREKKIGFDRFVALPSAVDLTARLRRLAGD